MKHKPLTATALESRARELGFVGAVLLPEQIARLELLRVIFNPSKDADTLIATAAKLEKYVMQGAGQPENVRKGQPSP